MASDDPSGARPQPVALRIKLKYDDVETLAARFAPNVGKSGLFLPTKSLQAAGTEVKFELRLATDKVVITGLGRVKVTKAPDPAAPRATFGMAIELMRVTRESRDVILKILAKRKELGLPEIAIPRAEDIDAARAQMESGVREAALSGVPSAVPKLDSGPVLESAPVLVAPANSGATTAPIAREKSAPSAPTPNPDSGPAPRITPTPDLSGATTAPVLTAPRRTSGSIPIQNLAAVAPLAPEPPRKKRPALSEVIDRASGPVQIATTVPGLDEDIDVGKVLARARTLAVGDLDAELESLRESAAAPIAISVEAASAELARQLGGAPVSKDRSAKWAPPPPIAEDAAVPQLSADAASAIEMATSQPAIADPVAPEAATTEVSAEPVAEPAADAVVEPAADAVVEPAADAVAEPAADAVAEPAADAVAEPADEPAVDERTSEPILLARESEPVIPIRDSEPVLEELHQLDETDFEEVEHTQIGASHEVESAASHELDPGASHALDPGASHELERSLEETLAAAEEEAAADDLGLPTEFSDDPAPVLEARPVRFPTAPVVEPEPEPEPEPDPEPEHQPEPAPADIGDEPGVENLDDFEILAEADAEDADLIEREVAASDDFADRLDLSDEHPRAPDLDQIADQESLDPDLVAGAEAALAAFSTPDLADEEDSTIEPPIGFPPLHKFDESDVIRAPAPEPTYLRARTPSSASTVVAPARRTNDGYDLETALEALDVDLDDLSEVIPPPQPAPVLHPRRSSQRPTTPSKPIPTRVPERATTDDGVLIDFDDDDE